MNGDDFRSLIILCLLIFVGWLVAQETSWKMGTAVSIIVFLVMPRWWRN